jgi:hypothetical protein
VVNQKIISIVLGGYNNINLNSGMIAHQSGADSVILLVGGYSDLHSPFNGFVKKIKFTTTYNDTNRGNTIILAAGQIARNKYIETDSITNIATVPPSYTCEFTANLRINTNDQVFVG